MRTYKVEDSNIVTSLHPAAYGVALFIFVAVGRLPELFPVLSSLALGKLAVALSVLGLFIAKDRKGPDVFKTPIGRWMAMFGFLATVSVSFSVWGSHSLEFLLAQFLGNLVLFFVIMKTASSLMMVRFYVTCLVLSAGLLSFLTVLLDRSDRLSVSQSYDPNDLAMVLVTVVPLAMLSFLVSGWRGKLVYGAIVAMMLVAIMLTASRGGFIGLLIVSGYLFLSKLPSATEARPTRFSLRKTVILIIGIIVIAMFTPSDVWQRFETMSNLEEDYNVTGEKGRLAIWSRGVDIMLSRPYGSGLAAFEAAEGTIGGKYKAAHNTLIQVGVELGVIGLFIFLALYRVSWRQLRQILHKIGGKSEYRAEIRQPVKRVHAYAVGFRGALLGFFITSFFLSSAYAAIFYVLMALIAGLSIAYKLEVDTPEMSAIQSSPATTGPSARF